MQESSAAVEIQRNVVKDRHHVGISLVARQCSLSLMATLCFAVHLIAILLQMLSTAVMKEVSVQPMGVVLVTYSRTVLPMTYAPVPNAMLQTESHAATKRKRVL